MTKDTLEMLACYSIFMTKKPYIHDKKALYVCLKTLFKSWLATLYS